MIRAGDIVTTNYAQWGERWRVVEIHRDCDCGHWSRWHLTFTRGRQRLPHIHLVALDLERHTWSWWNGLIERGEGLIGTSRMWCQGRFIHPQVTLIERAQQGSLL